MFDVMPYVDLYFKKQVLKNTDDYCREVYGTRTFCEYYHDMLKIEDDTITKRYYPHTEKQYLSKLRVAWNVGIGDLYAVKPIQLIIHPFSVTKPEFLSPDSERSLDVQYRGSGYSPIAGYPRSRSKELMMELMKESDIKISDITKLKKNSSRKGRTLSVFFLLLDGGRFVVVTLRHLFMGGV